MIFALAVAIISFLLGVFFGLAVVGLPKASGKVFLVTTGGEVGLLLIR